MEYPIALCHPFEPEAEGAQVPDMYTFPTQTSVMRTQFTISVPEGETNCDFVVQPNLFCTIAASTTVGGFDPISGGNQWFYSTYGPSGTNNTFSEHGMIGSAQLSQQYARYRVIQFGVRVRPQIQLLTQTGQISFSKVPALSHWMNYQETGGNSASGVVNTTSTVTINGGTGNGAQNYVCGSLTGARVLYPNWPQYLAYYELPGVDNTGYLTQTILSMPLAHSTSVANMQLDTGLEVTGQLCSADCFKWRDAANAVGGWYDSSFGQLQNGTYVNASQLLIQTDANVTTANPGLVFSNQIVGISDEDFLQQGGFSVLLFRANALPPNTQATAVFTVEVVFHIEGVPNTQAGTLISGAKFPAYHPGLLQASIAAHKDMPVFRVGLPRSSGGSGRKKRHHKPHISSVLNKVFDEVGGALGHAVSRVGESALNELSNVAMRGIGHLERHAGDYISQYAGEAALAFL